MHNFMGGGVFCLYYKEPNKTEDKKICGEYIMEATIRNKIRLDKCGVYTAKETLGFMVRKRSSKESGKPERGKRRNKPTNK